MTHIRAALQRKACPNCGSGQASEITYSDTQEFRGITLDLDGLRASVCSQCGQRWFSAEQTEANHATMKQAYVAKREQLREKLGLLSGVEIARLREAFGLSQKEASELFGGGPKSFNKYESGEVLQSQAMDKLLRITAFFGDRAIDFLRHGHGREQMANGAAPRNCVENRLSSSAAKPRSQ
ncbi:type II toxin-antitoxin system MqsA family antitoxin [Trinickia terrae]|uniref:Type II toxin-antitoxin system MqsA family antitoxin n=1 Tax=Trinickia terrae TaxID=2571161 RepID=A0A4U1HNG4_9BURK|nr:type II toxin-antitoxin system MqsA family antitoxin [Trinickia terrae]TKC81628.1 type II toxin-antitoxin system MqsA family antitoxin [Trinickia terrae]